MVNYSQARTAMVKPEMVGGIDNFSKIEGSLMKGLHRMNSYSWFAAGRNAGLLPDMRDIVDYGREYALVEFMENKDWAAATLAGLKAMYDLTYSACKGVIRSQYENRVRVAAYAATTVTEVSDMPTNDDYGDIELADWLVRSGLTLEQQQVALLYAAGWSKTELRAEVEGFDRLWTEIVRVLRYG